MDLTSVALSLSGLAEAALAIWPTLLYFLKSTGMTCLLVSCALSLGLLLGTFMASVQVYGPRWSGWLVSLYVWFFRGVPILVLMFLFYFGLTTQLESLVREIFGWRLRVPAFASAVIVLGLCSAAYQSQIFRGAMKSIPAGQFKAARALGMSSFQAVRVIILPQTLRISIPAWSNEYSILLKDSAIAFVIGVGEMMACFKAVASTTYRYLLFYALAGLVYYIITWVGVKLLLMLYERVRIPGLVEVNAVDSI